jgi:hypothetical protein
MQIMSAAIIGAFVTTFLWYFFNSWVDGVGIAYVRGLGWPVSTAWLMVCIGALLGMIGAWRHRRRETLLTAAVMQTAKDIGLEYVAKVERPTTKLKSFEKWYDAKNGLRGQVDGLSVSMLDLIIAVESCEGTDDYRTRTVAILPALGLPQFTVRKRTSGWRIAEAIGLTGLTFDPSGLSAGEVEILQQFTRAFRIELTVSLGQSGETQPELVAQEAKTRRLFNTVAMQHLLANQGCNFEADGEWLVIWKGDQFLPANERSGLLATALGIRKTLLTAMGATDAAALPSNTKPM